MELSFLATIGGGTLFDEKYEYRLVREDQHFGYIRTGSIEFREGERVMITVSSDLGITCEKSSHR